MSNDPYAAPTADLQSDAAAITTSMWSAKGRLGVLSYLGQSFVLVIVFGLIMSALIGVVAAGMGGLEGFSSLATAPENFDFSNMAVLVPLLILIPVFLIGMYVGICMLIKRLHDRGHSGWWALPLVVLSLIPIIGLITLIAFAYIMFFRGHKHANRFGGQRTTKGWEKVMGILYIIIIVGSLVVSLGGAALVGFGALSS